MTELWCYFFNCLLRYFALRYALILLLAIHPKHIESNTSVLMLLFFFILLAKFSGSCDSL